MTENKTVVRKKIGRKIQTARFESLEVSCEWEDQIVWFDPEERQAKLDKVTQAGLLDFERSFSIVCESLKVEERDVSIKQNLEDGTVKQGTASTPIDVEPEVKKSETKKDDGEFFDAI